MRRAAALLLALLLAAPAALAGSESSPEVSDPRDQSPPTVDLVAAWVENERDGVRVTWKLASVPEEPKGLLYALAYTIGGGSRRVAVVAFDSDGESHTIVERVGYGADYPGLDTYPDTVRDVVVGAGSPGTISGVVPWGASPGFGPGATMSILYAMTDDGRTGDGRDYVDVGEADARFLLEQPPVPASTYAAWAAAAAVALAALAALGVALVRRRRRPAVAPPPEPAPPPAPPAPPREETPAARFRLDPRERR